MKKLILSLLIASSTFTASNIALAAKQGDVCYSNGKGVYRCQTIKALTGVTIAEIYAKGFKVVAYGSPSSGEVSETIIIEQQ